MANIEDIPVGILAGGFGTRLAEETDIKPKPMVQIGTEPILWHIMKAYSAFGFKEFGIALGYKGEIIKDYFLKYHLKRGNLSVSLNSGEYSFHDHTLEDWEVHLIDTGLNTMTGGRVKRLAQFFGDRTFMLTYGDGVANVDLSKLLEFHQSHGKLVTITAVRPSARFGEITFDGDQVLEFAEKPQTHRGWINGGFLVVEPEIVDYIDGDDSIFERSPLETLANQGQLMAYKHEGFWQCMDTLRDKKLLEELWQNKQASWKVWS